MNRRRVVRVVAAVLLLAAAVGAAYPRGSDSRLAGRLVAVKSDLPPEWSYWVPFDETWLSQCLHRTPAVTAWSFSSLGSPHQGLNSVVSVLTTRAKAEPYYRTAVRAVPGCVRRWWPDASRGKVRRLAFRHFGTQSGAWRLPFSFDTDYRAIADWVVIRKGRAVLVDVFLLAPDLKPRTRQRPVPTEEGIVGHAIGRAN
jgi:hypothetical protein